MDISFQVQKRVDEETCLKCRFCCEHEVLTITNDDQLELAYRKGHKIIWDPLLNSWFLVLPYMCQYICKDGCTIYHHEKKAKLCRTWECHLPGKVLQINKILMSAAQKICKQKFGERIDATKTNIRDG